MTVEPVAAMRRIGRSAPAGDPETGGVGRAVGTVVVVALATARPPEGLTWVWACYGVAALGWVVLLCAAPRLPRCALAAPICSALVCASVMGVHDGTAVIILCVSLAMIATQPSSPRALILGVSAVSLVLTVVSCLVGQRPCRRSCSTSW